MKVNGNRDLLVLSKSFKLTPQELEREVEFLHALLYHAERMEIFCSANELININKYRIVQKPAEIWKAARAAALKPFVFISNKN